MECRNCGTTLPLEANFCSHCGKLQRPSDAGEEEQIEVCEVRYRNLKGRLSLRNAYEFEAVAVGPTGQRGIDTTGRITGSIFRTVESVTPALEALSGRLMEDGWQPLPSSQLFNLPRFWRRIGKAEE